MTLQNFTTQPIQKNTLVKLVLIGGGIGLALMAIFIAGVRDNLAWGDFWRLRPLLCATLGGAGGGVFFYFMVYFFAHRGNWQKAIATIIGIVGFLIALFLGSVYGMDGTLWN